MENILKQVAFNDQGLIAAVAQDATDGAVLMLAWMNAEALLQTIETGQVTYYSRSRQTLWRKGGTSGQTQELVTAALDCDGDAILLRVRQNGVACHTGRRSCFYRQIDNPADELVNVSEPEVSPRELYGQVTGNEE